MGKKDRRSPRTAFVTLRDLPGTRVMFWVVSDCPYCAGTHLHPAGNLRTDDPGDTLGDTPARCDPERRYVLTLPPRPNRKPNKAKRRQDRRAAQRDLDSSDWDE